MIKIDINGERSVARGPFPFAFVMLTSKMSGRKVWKNGTLTFDSSGSNIRLLQESELAEQIEFQDNTALLADMERLKERSSPYMKDYLPKSALYKHQLDALEKGWEKESFALLMEMGLGKTAQLITNAGMLYSCAKLTGVLVVAPKGVHFQWAEEQIPKHYSLPYQSIVWNKKPVDFRRSENLAWFCINYEALRTDKGWTAAEKFLRLHRGASMVILDESHRIKSYGSSRTRSCLALKGLATYRRISTGTPISKHVDDIWTQFLFLDEHILGHRYLSSFRAEFCVMGGWNNRSVVASRNLDRLNARILPHSFRITKAEALDLPEKTYRKVMYEMSDETRSAYDELKRTLMLSLADGTAIDVVNTVSVLVKLQQIVCGFIPVDGGNRHLNYERIEILLNTLEQLDGPVIIWARFIYDIEQIQAHLWKKFGVDSVVTYYGASQTVQRKNAVKRFLDGSARFFVSNPAAGGTGLNLQGACSTTVYYSNSFQALDRWQSEDRIHRIGTKGTMTYIDLVARRTIDAAILKNLSDKKSVSDLTLDEIRQMLIE